MLSQISQHSIEEENLGRKIDIECRNSSVARLDHPEKGVYFFESRNPVDDEVILLSAGIHGDELAGIKIIDDLREKILSGSLDLQKHVCFIDGNLKAMEQARVGTVGENIPESRYWSPDKQYGIEANANRMWKREYLDNMNGLASYASKRRIEIWKALNSVLKSGNDTNEFCGKLLHIDLHQSFDVPTVKQVRGNYHNDSQYTYGMAYGSAVSKSVDALKERFGEVYAGLVISNPSQAETFAAITSREFNASSVTAELGTIGSSDEITYSDKMLEVLTNELEGKSKRLCDLTMDIWIQAQTIIRKQEKNFGFYDLDGNIIDSIPDFVPSDDPVLIVNGDETFTTKDHSSFLFANNNVVVGDRAGVLIEKK